MKDSERISLIKTLIENGFGCASDNEEAGYWKGIVLGIEVLAAAETPEEKEDG